MIKILIIDDEPQVLEITRVFLERSGHFQVSTGSSAESGLLMLEDGDFDAVVSDYEMPKMNGLDFLKTVRLKGYTIPFIIFTGRSREDVVIEALNYGADYYIQKGGDPKSQFVELTHKILLAVEKKRSEKALSEANEYKDRLIESHIDPLLTIDKKYQIMDINSAMEELSGYRKEELKEKDLAELFKDGKEAKSALAIAFKNGYLKDYPLEIINRGGEVIPILFHATPYLNRNNDFLGFFTEFHEYCQPEQDLFEDRINNSEFYLELLTHDIRNMMTVEIGYLMFDDQDEQTVFWKERMKRLSGSITHLIANIDAMRRSEEICSDLKPVNIRSVIRREADNFRDLDIGIDDFDGTVLADELLASVFYNLLSNVRKHCGKGTKVEISAIENGETTTIFFEDFGHGMPGDLINEFNDGDYIDCDPSGKGGLGLGIIRNIIGNCGGQIIIRPDKNGISGTKFIINLKRHYPCENNLLLNGSGACLKNR